MGESWLARVPEPSRVEAIATRAEVVARLAALAGLGVERFVVAGATIDVDREAARLSERLPADEVLPALRERPAA